MKKLIKAALIRALYTVCETLVSTLPVGFVITPAMLQSMNWSFLFIVMAWLGTALFAGFCAFVRAMVAGLPEVNEDWVITSEDLEEGFMEDEDYDEH